VTAVTEAEWLAGCDVEGMLRLLQGKCSDRKLRLFALACCGRIAGHMTDARSRAAVAFAERYAEEGVARRRGRPAVAKAAHAAGREAMRHLREPGETGGEKLAALIAAQAAIAAWATTEANAVSCATCAASASASVAVWSSLTASQALPAWDEAARRTELGQQAALLRDIAGNPFRRAAVDPAWLAWNGGTVRNIAQAIYGEKAFERMPILADALEDAGCDDADILNHCRAPGVHVRGCWVVDLLLGKS
jgi:hypothetical protein